jgi:hypothetical protein
MGAPEIYYGGNGYILGAGGLQRSFTSQLGARPNMLLLNDHVGNRDSCFYLCAKGKMKKWNNTGVYRNFACSDQPAHIPPQYKPALVKCGWQLYHDPSGLLNIFTYSSKNVGLMFVSEDHSLADAQALDGLISANEKLKLTRQCMLPGLGTISYQLYSPKNKWVISKVDGKKIDRSFDKWQRMNVVN